MLTIAVTNGFILSNNLVLLLFFSFLLAILLYAFLIVSAQDSLIVAHQTFFIAVLFNVLISLGIYLIFFYTGSTSIITEPRITSANTLSSIAFLLILIGVIGKIGLIPLNFWTTKLTKSPITIMTFIPMLLDKIIGIYLLLRLSYYIFNINQMPVIRLVILLIGGVSIVIAGLMAVKTKEVYKLCNYSAITQFGFIFLGIGCANSFGLAGAIFHSINYLIFQPSLLLTAGSIEYWTKTTQLENFQGLASKMPITFFALLIAVLASIGIPPFNGFFSKLLLFQGIIKMNINGFNILFILIACIGCAITPIYFLRLLYSFKGKETKYSQRIRDPGFTMSFSPILLSILCIVLGIFVNSLSWKTIILPSVNSVFVNVSQSNPWSFGLAPILLIISVLVGIIIYYTNYLTTKIRGVV
jgi:formate hydrogenlyase subunit 3/multisubunit Na+/H+ antiporter MnhD subunit